MRLKFSKLLYLMIFSGLALWACSAVAEPSLTAAKAWQALNAGQITLIDIRTPEEWQETGVARGAVRIDLHHPEGAEGFVGAVLQAVNGDRHAPLALICRTGNRSGHIQQFLQSVGFTRVYDVSEGMAGSRAGPGWLKRRLPVDR